MDVPVGYFLASLAWAGLGVHFIAIPFYSRPEQLFKDLVDSGARDLALTNIETSRLIPALAGLFEDAERARDVRRTRGDSVEYKDLLQEFDYQPALKAAQDAVNAQRDIEQNYDSLCNIASRLWKLAFVHAICIVGIPTTLQLTPPVAHSIIVTLLAAGSSITFVVSGIYLTRYERCRNQLYSAVGRNREKQKSTQRSS